MSRFMQQNAMPADEGIQTTATVKWFNLSKGFGFAAPASGPDAFLHISVLNRAGLDSIQEGTEMVCFVGSGPKGPQVTRIVEITGVNESFSGSGDRGGDRNSRPRFRDSRPERDFYPREDRDYDHAPAGPETEMSGTIKWFKPDKGFGFAATDDDSRRDVFIHKNVLRRAGLMTLEPGQRVQMRVQEAAKGREATWIIPLSE
ncbi:MAG: cold shock domain-containing protein [Pseudomonadota bacterium]|nr:cold shock domain-containing protein [Pseudomonadota bacterium]